MIAVEVTANTKKYRTEIKATIFNYCSCNYWKEFRAIAQFRP